MGINTRIGRKVLVIGLLLTLVLGMTGVVKGQEIYITAKIYQSDGTAVGDGYDGTPATVLVIEHDTGEVNRYEVPGGLRDGHVIFSLSTDAISENDIIRIEVDGSPWGDVNYYAEYRDAPGVFDIQYEGEPGPPYLQLQTLRDYPLALEWIIALIFIILILATGYAFLVGLNRQKLRLAVTGKEQVVEQTKQGVKQSWKYACSYGEPDDLTEIAEFNDVKDFPESSILMLSVRKLVKTPEGIYASYDPRPVDMSKLPQEKLPTEVDSEEKVDKKWFQGGALKLEKGESMEHASKKHAHLMFGAVVYPFLLLELIFGVGSFFYESLRFPPFLIILIINIIIFVVALAFQAFVFRRATRKEKPSALVPPKEMPAVAPEPPGSQALSEEESASLDEILEEVKRCPKCGEPTPPDFVVCPKCGESLQ